MYVLLMRVGCVVQRQAGVTSDGVGSAIFRRLPVRNVVIMMPAKASVRIPCERKGVQRLLKKVHIRFEQDASLDHIDVVIRAPDQDDSVTDLINRISARPPDMLTAYDENGNVRKLDQKKIVLASVNGKVVDLITDDGIWHIRQTLQNLEDNLDKQRFVRISRYEIVNVEKILKYDFTVAGTLRIELTGGMETWASRRCIPAIRRRLTGKGWE
jgi:DNA-binding LytR/AlgR family response regulator